MIEKWRKTLDSGKLAGALFTDLPKAFDYINHSLMIAELHAYGFDQNSLTYVYSYLSGGKQRSKVNNSLGSWAPIKTGISVVMNQFINDWKQTIAYSLSFSRNVTHSTGRFSLNVS